MTEDQQFDGVLGIVVLKSSPEKFLLVNNQRTGNLTFPAGTREGQETAREAIIREIQEETSLAPNDYQLTQTPFAHQFVYNKKKEERFGQTVRQIVFLIETTKEDVDPQDQSVTIEGWYIKEEILNRLTFDGSKELLKKVEEWREESQ